MPDIPRPLTVMVTGASNNLGTEVAGRFAADGHTVVLHADDPDSGDRALERLVKGGAEPLRLDVVTADLARLGEVTRMARRVAETHPSLDLLVHTAHFAGAPRRVVTEDGNELTFQVNYLAPYLLTRLLEGPLCKPASSRVVYLCSTLLRGGDINWADPTRTRRYTQQAAYAQAALATAMHTAGFAERSDGVTPVCVDPGPTDRAVLRMHAPWVQPATDAADIVTRLCAPTFEVTAGGCYDRLRLVEIADAATEPRLLRRLAKLSEQLTGLSR
jgi:NAD(P)-dependent dehydrogenase (short-subunit alcohol dehydrogenase family)